MSWDSSRRTAANEAQEGCGMKAQDSAIHQVLEEVREFDEMQHRRGYDQMVVDAVVDASKESLARNIRKRVKRGWAA